MTMMELTFENLEEVKRAYAPEIVDKALHATIKRLTDRVATETSREVRKVYSVKHRDITAALVKRVIETGSQPVGSLMYISRRLSLRHFVGGKPTRVNRPKVKTRRGVRYGAKVRVRKNSQAKVLGKAFWGRGRAGSIDGSGEWQIFQRIGLGRLKIRKLTGPGVAQMVRSSEAQRAADQVMSQESSKVLAEKLDHFILKKVGLR